MLRPHIETLCADMLSAGSRKGHYWTVGSTSNDTGGSMFVHLTGLKAGNWRDAGTGEFGDALDLFAQCLFGGDKKRAYHHALGWLGIDGKPETVPRPAPKPRAREAGNDDEKRRAYAQSLWLNAHPAIAHTPVDSYLIGRGIRLADLGRQPRALRYHPALYHRPSRCKFPAMLAAISGPDGSHLATHRTWLERAGGGWIKARVEDPKMTIGTYPGGSIRLSRGASKKPLKDAPADDVVVIGEGIETCLSIALACPDMRVISAVSLGNFGSVWLPEQLRLVVLAADNDTKPAAQVAFQRVVECHLALGRQVRIARSPVGKDFNDALQGE